MSIPSAEFLPRVVSIQVGAPRTYGMDDAADPMDRTWTTGFFKQPVVGPVNVSQVNIEGDRQAEPVNHGGVDKAVLGYSADHYPKWKAELAIAALDYGAFGENLTLLGLTEDTVCIGDVWECSSVLLQVSQPRQPCWKLARRWRRSDLPKRVIQTGRTGWYYRVLRTGELSPDSPIVLVERPHASWTIERANQTMYAKNGAGETRRELAALPELSASWQVELSRKN